MDILLRGTGDIRSLTLLPPSPVTSVFLMHNNVIQFLNTLDT